MFLRMSFAKGAVSGLDRATFGQMTLFMISLGLNNRL